ncbi:MAG: hypothetical protein JNL39_17435 [Opitutaceae bacterium]|nr:hypothetical protein [Opitutaceae bacterium]
MKADNNFRGFIPLKPETRGWIIFIGALLVIGAVAGYYRPPVRESFETRSAWSKETDSVRPTSRKQISSDQDSTSFVVVVLVAGVALLAFGLNGMRITKLGSSMVDLSTHAPSRIEESELKEDSPSSAAESKIQGSSLI